LTAKKRLVGYWTGFSTSHNTIEEVPMLNQIAVAVMCFGMAVGMTPPAEAQGTGWYILGQASYDCPGRASLAGSGSLYFTYEHMDSDGNNGQLTTIVVAISAMDHIGTDSYGNPDPSQYSTFPVNTPITCSYWAYELTWSGSSDSSGDWVAGLWVLGPN
jgi:hypothetical protein